MHREKNLLIVGAKLMRKGEDKKDLHYSKLSFFRTKKLKRKNNNFFVKVPVVSKQKRQIRLVG